MNIYSISAQNFGIAIMESIQADSEKEAKNMFLAKHIGFSIYGIIQL